MDLNVRDVPDSVHAVLVARAAARGMSLRAYVVEVLAEHTALPTITEWLAELAELPPAVPGRLSATEALDAERAERDDQIATSRPEVRPAAG